MPKTIDESARKLIEAPNFAHNSMHAPDGSIYTVVSWVDVEDGHVLLNTAEGRKWPEYLRRDGRVTISIHNEEKPYEYLTIRGRIVKDTHDGADEHIDRMAKKYLGEDTYPFRQPGEQRVIFKVEPEAVIHVGQ